MKKIAQKFINDIISKAIYDRAWNRLILQSGGVINKRPKSKDDKSTEKEYQMYLLYEDLGIVLQVKLQTTAISSYDGNHHVVNGLMMPYMKCDLQMFLKRRIIPSNHFFSLVYQVTKCVLVFHRCGFVHRDINLSNFVYNGPDSNKVYLIDFEDTEKAHTTVNATSKMIGGTSQYMLPSRRKQKIEFVSYYIDIIGLLVSISKMLHVKPYVDERDDMFVTYYVNKTLENYKIIYESVNSEFVYFMKLFENIKVDEWENLNSKGRRKFTSALRSFQKYNY